MATRRRTSHRRRASTNVMIDLTCDPDSDSEGEVFIVGEAMAAASATPLRIPDSPVNIVGMHIVVDPTLQQSLPGLPPPIQPPPALPSPPPPVIAATDYPRNSTETQLETELSDLAIDVSLLQSYLRERDARALRTGLERRLRELRLTHGVLVERVGQLTAGRRLRFEGLVRPLGAELDEMHRLIAEVRDQAAPQAGPSTAWQQRDGGGPLRTRRSIFPDDLLSLPPYLPPESPLQASPAPATAAVATQADKPPSSPPRGASNELHCPVCWDSVSSLKEQHRSFLVTRCGHWFCEPCLKGACRVRRECPICRAKLQGRPCYRPLYL